MVVLDQFNKYNTNIPFPITVCRYMLEILITYIYIYYKIIPVNYFIALAFQLLGKKWKNYTLK